MVIRAAKKEDLLQIIRLIADDKLGATRENYKDPLPQEYSDAFTIIQRDPYQELMVLEDTSGHIIGTMQLSFIQYLTYIGGIRAQIEAVRIHKDYRNQGIGQQLFTWAIARAKEKGAHVIQLTTDKQRPEALHFYEKLGFKASHEGMKLHLLK
jgi:GNAT superfamily N-acetyltransferase